MPVTSLGSGTAMARSLAREAQTHDRVVRMGADVSRELRGPEAGDARSCRSAHRSLVGIGVAAACCDGAAAELLALGGSAGTESFRMPGQSWATMLR
jgi:hypothetical protein